MTETTYADWQRERECARKTRHPHQLSANMAVLRVWARGEWARSYRCRWCAGWHLTGDREEWRDG